MSKFRKSKTAFTKRKHHSNLSDGGIIFENDYSTLTGITLPIPSATTYSQGNFKIVTNNDESQPRMYGVGEWITSNECDRFIKSGDVLPNISYVVFSLIGSGEIVYNGITYKNNQSFEGVKGVVDFTSKGDGQLLLSNEECFWTIDDIESDSGDIPTIVMSNKLNNEVVLNPDYTYLSSFAYFGSTYELITASFVDIINRFPASLWCRPKPENKIFGLYELVNNFDIDIISDNIDNNTLKNMYLNNSKYEIIETKYLELSHPIQNQVNNCSNINYYNNFLQEKKYDIISFTQKYRYITNNGIIYDNEPNEPFLKQIYLVKFEGKNETDRIDIIIDYHYHDKFDGDPCILKRITTDIFLNNTQLIISGDDPSLPEISYHIRPKKEEIDNYFLSLNDFQSIILNKNTNPRYTSIFKVPVIDEDNVVLYEIDERFTWTTSDGWNLDIDSNSYLNLVDNLKKVAIFLDETKSDNLYNRMTHESIKNMDTIHSMIEVGETNYIEGEHRLQQLIRLYGRFLDQSKKYIDGLSYVNNISYDKKANIPDNYLLNQLNLKGWMLKTPVTNQIRNDVTNPLYYGYLKQYTSIDLEKEFYRRLLINSNQILRSKGTKNAFEMLFNLFGISRDNWEIKEYIYVSRGTIDQDGNHSSNPVFTAEQVNKIITLNKGATHTLSGFVFEGSNTNLIDEDDDSDDLNGLTIAKHYYDTYEICNICKGVGVVSSNTFPQTMNVVCPKCYGFGYLRDFVGVPFFKGNSERLYYQQMGGWYEETKRYLNIVNTVDNLLELNKSDLLEGDIYYVNIINDNLFSTNYFVLIDINSFNNINGWENIPKNKFDTFTSSNGNVTVSVSKLLNITDILDGNNPHVGYNEYDFGINYIQFFAGYNIENDNKYIEPIRNLDRTLMRGSVGLFKYIIDNAPECIKDFNQYKDMLSWGFDMVEVMDSKKSWYVNQDGYLVIDNNYSINPNHWDIECENEIINVKYIEGYNIRKVDYSKLKPKTRVLRFNSDDNILINYNQVVNTKQISLVYKGTTEDIIYFEEVILPLINQMIPSSMIFRYDIINTDHEVDSIDLIYDGFLCNYNLTLNIDLIYDGFLCNYNLFSKVKFTFNHTNFLCNYNLRKPIYEGEWDQNICLENDKNAKYVVLVFTNRFINHTLNSGYIFISDNNSTYKTTIDLLSIKDRLINSESMLDVTHPFILNNNNEVNLSIEILSTDGDVVIDYSALSGWVRYDITLKEITQKNKILNLIGIPQVGEKGLVFIYF